jgi:hypothetical protein
MISAIRVPLFRFSTSTITNKTFSKFQEKYIANIEAFKAKVNSTSQAADTIKKSTRRVYVHPFEDPHKKISVGPVKTYQL